MSTTDEAGDAAAAVGDGAAANAGTDDDAAADDDATAPPGVAFAESAKASAVCESAIEKDRKQEMLILDTVSYGGVVQSL